MARVDIAAIASVTPVTQADSTPPAGRRQRRTRPTTPADDTTAPDDATPQPAQRAPRRRRATATPPTDPTPDSAPQPVDAAPATPAADDVEPTARTSSTTRTRPTDPPLPDGIPGQERITLPLWRELHRALALARVDDGIDTTVRIRTMIELWAHDARLRARVDRLAAARHHVVHRGRPRRDTDTGR